VESAVELGELTREWFDDDGKPLKVGDRVELVGFEGAYNPPNPQGYIYGDSVEDGPAYFAIWFDDDVQFRSEDRPVPRPFGGFDDTSVRRPEPKPITPCAECEKPAERGDYLCGDCRLAISVDCV
jgi:hypothetical protein